MPNSTCKGEVFDMKAEMKAHMECVQEIFPRGSTTPSSATDEDKKKMFQNQMKEIMDNAASFRVSLIFNLNLNYCDIFISVCFCVHNEKGPNCKFTDFTLILLF